MKNLINEILKYDIPFHLVGFLIVLIGAFIRLLSAIVNPVGRKIKYGEFLIKLLIVVVFSTFMGLLLGSLGAEGKIPIVVAALSGFFLNEVLISAIAIGKGFQKKSHTWFEILVKAWLRSKGAKDIDFKDNDETNHKT